jgi:hypothetical protein
MPPGNAHGPSFWMPRARPNKSPPPGSISNRRAHSLATCTGRAPPAPLTWIAAPALNRAVTPLVRQRLHVGDRMNELLADPVADAPHAT